MTTSHDNIFELDFRIQEEQSSVRFIHNVRPIRAAVAHAGSSTGLVNRRTGVRFPSAAPDAHQRRSNKAYGPRNLNN